MSPLFQRRLTAFRRHRRGWFSLHILIGLFVFVLAAPWICNDVPYVVHLQGKTYWPIFKDYPEKVFGGTLDGVTDFKDPLIKNLIQEKGGWMIWPPVPYNGSSVNVTCVSPAPPSFENWWGTDDQGRDVFARFMYGLRTSLTFGFLLTLLSLVLGVFMGAIQGYFGGLVDLVGQRFQELWSSLPILFILIVLSSFVQPNLVWLLAIMLLFSWMGLAALVRAEFLRGRTYDYVRAAKVLGVAPMRIM